jgi:hypothetical protein
LHSSIFIYSQELEKQKYDFSTVELNSKIIFKPELDLKYFSFRNDKSFISSDVNFTFDSDQLNKKLFSSFEIIENSYLDHEQFFRGCGYLEDGLYNPVSSGGLMLSLIINNFINNIVLDGKGLFARFLNN